MIRPRAQHRHGDADNPGNGNGGFVDQNRRCGVRRGGWRI
jgi:hypothetical protein